LKGGDVVSQDESAKGGDSLEESYETIWDSRPILLDGKLDVESCKWGAWNRRCKDAVHPDSMVVRKGTEGMRCRKSVQSSTWSVGVICSRWTRAANVNETERFDWEGGVGGVLRGSFHGKGAMFNYQHTQIGKRMDEGVEVDGEEHTAEDDLYQRCKRGDMREEGGVESIISKEARLVGIL
jgi:hypothetical protein